MPTGPCAHHFAVAKPRFSVRRSFSMVLSRDCLGQPILCLQSAGDTKMQAWRAWCKPCYFVCMKCSQILSGIKSQI